MKKKFYKYIPVIMLVLIVFLIYMNNTYAANWWKIAGNWYNDATANGIKDDGIDGILTEFENLINIIGTTIIAIATVFLGIKYMFASVDGKAEVKENLITLLVACVFFFGWQAIANALISGNNLILVNNSSYKSTLGNITGVVMLVANVLMIVAVIYVGIRYIFAGASGKADLKGKSGQFIIGIILSFCVVGVLTYISNLVNEIF